MEYEEILDNLQRNEKLNTKGLNELIGILRRKIIDLKQEIIELETKLQYKNE